MPILLDGSHPPIVRVNVGDVLMIARQSTDKQTKKPFTWKFFAVVQEMKGRHTANVIRLGAAEGRDNFTVWLRSDEQNNYIVQYLPPEEWPDGVHVFRMRLILEGRLDAIL